MPESAAEGRSLELHPSAEPGAPPLHSDRPDWDEYFMRIAELVATRSTCIRRQVGAVIVKDKRIVTTGYNGPPSEFPLCAEAGCLRDQYGLRSGERQEIGRSIHAEQNAIIQAATTGVSIAGGHLYCTNQPCILCAKMLINARMVAVTFRGEYPDALAQSMLRQGGVELRQLPAKGG